MTKSFSKYRWFSVKILAILVGIIYLWCMVNLIGGWSYYGRADRLYAIFYPIQTQIIIFFSCILFMSAIDSGMPNDA